MRCRFCGSNSIHEDKEHKNFSTGKAVAGAVTFGIVGAVAGFIGKEQNGYRCGACGAFMETCMDGFTEIQIESAIIEAEAGRERQKYDYYKSQYPNIIANIPQSTTLGQESLPVVEYVPASFVNSSNTKIKRSYRYGKWSPDCPVYVNAIIIKTVDGTDKLSLDAYNQSDKTIRSVYFSVKVYDDAGDEASSCRCVYQGLNVPGGDSATEPKDKALPIGKEFPLGTDIAHYVDIICEKVAFEDDEVWRISENDTVFDLPNAQIINEQNFPRFKYLPHTAAWKVLEISPVYLPVDQESYYICSCGHPVKKGERRCSYCHLLKEVCIEGFNQEHLRKLQYQAVKDRAAKRAKKTIAAYDVVANKEKELKYQSALLKAKADNKPSVNQAIKIFKELGDYKDSQKQIEFCKSNILKIEERKKKDLENRYLWCIDQYEQADTEIKCDTAKKNFLLSDMKNYKESLDYIKKCEEKAENFRKIAEEEIEKEKEAEKIRKKGKSSGLLSCGWL